MSEITAVLPAYNEEVSIGSMVLCARQYADRVVVVDDGSHDRTSAVAEMAGAEVVRHPQNMGKGAALKTGFEVANGTDIIVTVDSDGQHDPAEIPKLVAPILSGEADVVIGSRYISGRKTSTPAYRRAGQMVLDRVTNMDSGLAITDTQSGFRAFASHTLDAFRFDENGLGIESEMLVDAARAGFRIKEVEIGVRYDVNCSKKHPLSHGLEVITRVLRDLEMKRPLFWLSVPGTLVCGCGVMMGLFFVYSHYSTGAGLQFGPALLMSLLLIVGSFMMLAGIILHSIAVMVDELKSDARPLRANGNGHANYVRDSGAAAAASTTSPYYLKDSILRDKDGMALRIEKLRE